MAPRRLLVTAKSDRTQRSGSRLHHIYGIITATSSEVNEVHRERMRCIELGKGNTHAHARRGLRCEMVIQ